MNSKVSVETAVQCAKEVMWSMEAVETLFIVSYFRPALGENTQVCTYEELIVLRRAYGAEAIVLDAVVVPGEEKGKSVVLL